MMIDAIKDKLRERHENYEDYVEQAKEALEHEK